MFKYFSFSDLQYFWKKKHICISFQSAFSDLQNFFQSDLYFISMYKWQGLLQRLVQFYPQNSTCKILRPYGASSIGYNFGHLHSRRIWSLVANLATKFKIWSSGGATCIGSNVGYQVGSQVMPHCLELPYSHYQLLLSWYPHQLSLNKVAHSLS